MPRDLPSGWRIVTLDEVAKCEMGETLIQKDLTGSGVPVFSAGSSDGPWGWTSHARKKFKRGTIIVGARGTLGNPRLPNYDEFVSTQTTIAIHPASGCDPKYLLYSLILANLNDRGAKQAIPMLTVKNVNEVTVALPPFSEQRRIADILSSVDEAIQAVQAVIDQSQKIQQGVLERLLTKGIGHTQFKQTAVGEIPDNWEVGSITTLGTIVTGKTPSTTVKEFWDGDIPFITPGDLDDRVASIEKAQRYVSESGARTGKLLPAYSVLVTCIGSTIGKVGISNIACLTNQQINTICCKPEISHYVYEVARFIKPQLEKMSGKQAVPIINKRTFSNIQLPIPSLNEQIQLSKIAEGFHEMIAEERRHMNQLRCLKSSLATDLLTGRVRVSADIPMAAE